MIFVHSRDEVLVHRPALAHAPDALLALIRCIAQIRLALLYCNRMDTPASSGSGAQPRATAAAGCISAVADAAAVHRSGTPRQKELMGAHCG